MHMGVSKNSGTPKSSISIGVFHYKPSILGYLYFWKHPHGGLGSLVSTTSHCVCPYMSLHGHCINVTVGSLSGSINKKWYKAFIWNGTFI